MSRRAAEGRPQAARKAMNPAEPERLAVYEYDRRSNYEQDTHLTSALDALLPEAELTHPDQRLFQTIHLITEYAWCGMHFEMRRAAALLREGDHLFAARILARAAAVGAIPVQALRIMIGYLPQHSLLTMRETFPENTTGLDSPGARNLRRMASVLYQAFAGELERYGLTLTELIAQDGRVAAAAETDRAATQLAVVRQALLDLDAAVSEWRQTHLRLVWVQLGGHPSASERAGRPATASEGDGQPHPFVAGPEDAGQPHPSTAPPQRDGNQCPALPLSLSGQSISNLRQIAERSLFPQLWDSIDATYRIFTTTSEVSR